MNFIWGGFKKTHVKLCISSSLRSCLSTAKFHGQSQKMSNVQSSSRQLIVNSKRGQPVESSSRKNLKHEKKWCYGVSLIKNSALKATTKSFAFFVKPFNDQGVQKSVANCSKLEPPVVLLKACLHPNLLRLFSKNSLAWTQKDDSKGMDVSPGVSSNVSSWKP